MSGSDTHGVDGEHRGTVGSSARMMRDLLGLGADAIAVFLIGVDDDRAIALERFEPVNAHRYCQILMRARHGEAVRIEPSELACPAAAAAFGFRPLPDGLASGRGLVAFGIVQAPGTGHTMFDQMPRLPSGSLTAIAACPLALAPATPDVVIVEDRPEALMWLVLADLNRHGGARRRSDTAVLQATCVDATVIPHIEQRLNFSLGCYGCREATDLTPSETVLGFPGAQLDDLVTTLEHLSETAIPRSRAKRPYQTLDRAAAVPGGPASAARPAEPGVTPAPATPCVDTLTQGDGT
jgi:uncharacterized protein (DUF169 family)